MNQKEDVGTRLKQACLSGSVTALEALIEEDELILNRVSSLAGFSNDTPLHVAALCGHLDFTIALLTRKPSLATELDSRRCSPLHLASAEGHVEIVQVLVREDPNVCIARDQDGRIPLHLAAMNGRVEVIQELLGAAPNSIHEKLGREETVLHLCVKYSKLEALKLLVQYLQSHDEEFLLNSGDNDGHTILHLAVGLKQIDTVKYLLGIKSVKDHSTAWDVVEFCLNRDQNTLEIQDFILHTGACRSHSTGPVPNPESPPQQRCKAWAWICSFWKKYFTVDHDWLQQIRGNLITAATLTAGGAYQAILSPPGGVWSETTEKQVAGRAEQVAGRAVLADNDGGDYVLYLIVNTIVLIASLCTIIVALSGFSNHNKFFIWLMIVTVFITIVCVAVSYLLAVKLVFYKSLDEFWAREVLSTLLYIFYGLCAIVVVFHAFLFLLWLCKKLRKCYVTSRGPRAPKVNIAAGSRRRMGNI